MIQEMIIGLFLFSVFVYFILVKIHSLNQEMKYYQKQRLNCQFKICHNKGIMKGIRMSQVTLRGKGN